MTQGQPILAGTINTATASTQILSTFTAVIALGQHGVQAEGSTGAGVIARGGNEGIRCEGGNAVVGPTAVGLDALSHSSDGVRAHGKSNGVFGSSNSINASGVYGESFGGGWGVAGRTGGAARTGVWGDNTGRGNGVLGTSQGPDASGVYGENNAGGWGVAGRTAGTTHSAVWGENTGGGEGVRGTSAGAFAVGVSGVTQAGGTGVLGTSDGGVGVLAVEGTGAGAALQVSGRAAFSSSGVATIAAGASQITIAATLGADSLVLAILQQDRPGIHVRSAAPDVAAQAITVRLNQAVGQTTRVGWFVVN
jgi:hypothetical protein